jgi:hypothetical protein
MGTKRFDITNTKLPASKPPSGTVAKAPAAPVKPVVPPMYGRVNAIREAITATQRRERNAGLTDDGNR